MHTQEVKEVVKGGGANNGRTDTVLRENPCESDLSHRNPMLFSELLDAVCGMSAVITF